VRYSRAVAEVTQRTCGYEIQMSRSAFTGSQAHALHFGGDAETSNRLRGPWLDPWLRFARLPSPNAANPALCRFRACSLDAVVEHVHHDKEERRPMRVMVLIKANEDSEAGKMPSQELLTQMQAFNEELMKAGVMLAGDGLQPSSKGARVAFSGDDRKVIDGPFAETKELLAGYWVWQVKSLDEAIEWVKRIPNPDGTVGGVVEIRPVFEPDDFGDALTPEMRERDARLCAQVESGQ
jgi:hypothetical protein